MMKNKTFLLVLAAALFSVTMSAQVTGTVLEASTDYPIIGASVVEVGTTNGVITDFDGNFELKVKEGAKIQISYVGFKSITVTAKKGMVVKMEEDSYALQEVVAIGYGSQTKKEITGSVSSVKAEDFNQGVAANAMGLIQGKVAGLTIMKNGGDDPAQNNYQVQLRGVGSLSGSASPLYVIDGVPGGDLSSVLPSDIESIDVLKDGSAAAIYGTRANAGVILITTKRGSKDGKFHAEYNGSVNTAVMADAPRVLTADEYRQYMVAAGRGTDMGGNTNWMKEITRTPVSHTHNISISGGNENFNFRASAGYRGLQGMVINSDFQEINARFAANQKTLNKRLELAYDFSYTSIEKAWANYDNLNQAIRANPTMPVKYDPEKDKDNPKFHKYGGYYESDNFYSWNPVSDIEQTTNDAKNQVIMGSIRATLNIIDGLKFSTFYSIQNNHDWNGKYQKSTLRSVEGKGGVANQSYGSYTQQVVENTLNYINEWNGHSFQAMLGQSYQTELSQGFNAYNSDFPLDDLLYNNLGMGEGKKEGADTYANMGSYKYKDKLASFFARVMWNYDQRYFLNASVRFEGSSKFGPKASKVLGQWGVFPSISGSWNIKGEDFMADIEELNEMKLRLGYGVTGNMPGDHYLYLMRVAPGGDYLWSNGAFIQPWGPSSNVNESLRWEEKHELNLGFDFAAFKHRFSGSLDAYFRNTTDLLWEYDVPMPPYPFGKMWDNYGQIHNYGIELLLNGVLMETKNFKWDLGFNASWNRNMVVRITGEKYGQKDENGNYIETYMNVGGIGGDGLTGVNAMRLQEGQPIGNFYGFKAAGLDEKGTLWYYKKDGSLTKAPKEDDKQIIGNAQPYVNFGLNTTLRYKEFDFALNFRGQIGGTYFNETRFFYEQTRGVENCLLSAWNATNGTGAPYFTRVMSDYYLEDASYLKLNDLTIGYTPKLPEGFAKYVNYIRVSFTAQNLFTITGYSGHDPSSVNMSGLTPGYDGRSYYPTQRTFNLGLQFRF